MFFDEEYNIDIIDAKSIDQLELEQNILVRVLNPTSRPEEWAYFSYLKGLEAGLNDMYAISFGYYMSSFIGGMGIDAGTDVYFRLDMDEKIFDLLDEEINKNYPDEKVIVHHFFHRVLKFYLDDDGACTYEKAVFGHNIRVSIEVKEWFVSRRQSTKQTLIQLMKHTLDVPRIVSNGKDENISFKLTYSQEEKWNEITGDNDVEKLRTLLGGEI